HAHFGSRTARLGEPIMMIGDRIIRNARTISDAIDLAKKSRRVANWSFVVASSKSNESVILEMSPDRVEVYQRNDSPLAHSNYFRHPSLQNDETNLCGAYAADLRGRKCSVENYIKERAGLVTAEDMYSALGSPVDPFTNRVHLCGNVAAAVTTIQSSVFEPETQTFWTSVRQESPASLGPFIKINVPSFWKSVDSGEWAPPPLLANKNAGVSDHYLLAMRAFREAYKIFQMEPSDSTTTRRAFEKVNDAISYVSGDSHLLIHAGLLAFKLWEFPASAKMFTNAKAAGLSYHLQNVADLFLARCFDLDGRREPAIEIYKNDTNISDPRLRGAYRDGRSRAYEAKRVRDVQFDLQFPDCFRY
ncbi:MAG: carcinine hydrolase/isopenicillin-N N-acyltransferase family protein, partial [Planctomycetota bacterium]